MSAAARWIDLLDPSREELLAECPVTLHPRAIERLTAQSRVDHDPRPTFEPHGDYVFGVLLVPVGIPNEDRVVYQEIDLVLTPEAALTVRKAPPGEQPFDLGALEAACDAHGSPSSGVIAYYLVDEVAERYLEVVDLLDTEIDADSVIDLPLIPII